MLVTNRQFAPDAKGNFPTAGYHVLDFDWPPQIPADQADVEFGSKRLPSESDWELVSGHVWAKAVAGANAKTVQLEDDGADITDAVTVVAGAQTEVTFTKPKRAKGGSEVQLKVTTGATTTIDGLSVRSIWRPYPMSEAGQAVT